MYISIGSPTEGGAVWMTRDELPRCAACGVEPVDSMSYEPSPRLAGDPPAGSVRVVQGHGLCFYCWARVGSLDWDTESDIAREMVAITMLQAHPVTRRQWQEDHGVSDLDRPHWARRGEHVRWWLDFGNRQAAGADRLGRAIF